jgi:heat shock protein HspQ
MATKTPKKSAPARSRKASPVRKTRAAAAATPRSRARKASPAPEMRKAKFALGEVVRHRVYAFRGVIFDIDPVFNNTEEWWLAIPENLRPRKDQPFYHLLAENSETEYVAYVSEQNLQSDDSGEPLRHPRIPEFFIEDEQGRYRVLQMQSH